MIRMSKKGRGAMAKIKFISTISKMGNYRVIRIPSKIQKEIEPMEGKDIRVIVDDEL
jgi:antitoxin component of MazEF toxin-antitoxin module